MKNNAIIIDGNSLVNRAFYALPPLNNSKGEPTNAVYGFTTMLLRAISDYKPKFVAVAFDVSAPTFRHKKYELYKATRKKMPDELRVQMPILKQMLNLMGIKILELAGFEADDILGTVANNFSKVGIKTYIVTGDKDALQLINDNTSVLITKRGLSEIFEYTPATLLENLFLTPSQIIDYKALCGDSSDNIPGVTGVGDKTATELIKDFKTLDGVYENIETLKGKLKERLITDKENAYLSKDLATIDIAVPIEFNISECNLSMPFSSEVKRFFIDNAFKSLVKKDELFDGNAAVSNDTLKVENIEPTVLGTSEELDKIVNQKGIDKLTILFSDTISFALNNSASFRINVSDSLLSLGLDFGTALKSLAPLLQDKKVQKIVFDAKAIKKQLIKNSIKLNNYFDIKLAQYLVDLSQPLDSVGNLLQSYGVANYNCPTALFSLQKVLSDKLKELNMATLFSDMELPLVEVLFNMEQEGFKVDTKKLQELGADFSTRIEKLSNEIQSLANQTFNVNSPKQLGKVLFEDLKIPYPKKDNKLSTASEILEQLEDSYPIVKKVIEFRSLSKLNSTYVEGLLRAAGNSGLVKTEFKQMLTTTGRLSSVEPNLQNIPTREDEGRELRKAFVAKDSSRVLICADYSQIELRLLAHFSADPIMLAAFKDNLDIHLQTASEVFGVPLADVTSKMRREAKAVNFGIIYGISDFGLAKNLGVSRFVAKDYITKYFAKFTSIKQYLDECISVAKQHGYATTLFNRQRRIPELQSSNPHLRGFGERVAMNMPLQGSAADIIKLAMLKVEKALVSTSAKLILQVHDELIVEADKKDAEQVAKLVKESMETAASLKVPLTVDAGVGNSWFDCK